MSSWSESLYHHTPVPVQNWLLTLQGWRLRRVRFDRRYRQLRAEFQALERSSPAEQEAYQAERLVPLIRHCYENVPYYRRIFETRRLVPDDIRGPRDLIKLPVLEKEEVRRHFRELRAENVGPRHLRLAHTSGTTGTPLACYWDREVDRATNAVLWEHRSWSGFEFGLPYAAMLGRLVVPPGQDRPPFWRLNRAWNQLFLSSFHLDETTADSYLGALREFRPLALEAYPSTAYLLACHLRARGETLPLKWVFTSAETLLPLQRELIQERFACPVYDYLGEAERVLFAGECPAGEGMHLFTGYGISEVVDHEDRPRERGQPGHLVLTGLHNYAMPLLRYRLGDVSALLDRSCSCGRTLPLMHPVTTKAEDIVVTPEGRFISSSVLTHPFKPMTNILASQIVQESRDQMIIRIVRRPTYTDRDSRILMGEMAKRVGSKMRIEIEFVESIPRSPSGKLRWVVSKVPLRFGDWTTANLFGELESVGGNAREGSRTGQSGSGRG